jgi:hypothetical protein
MNKFIISVFFIFIAASVKIEARETWVGLNLRFQPLYFETNKLNVLTWGVGGETSFFPIKRFLAQGRYSSSIFSNSAARDYKSYYQKDASPALKPFTYWEAGAQFNVIVNEGTYLNKEPVFETYSVWNADKGVYETRYRKIGENSFFTNEYRMYGIRGGILALSSGMQANIGNSSDTIRDANGAVIDDPSLAYTNHKMSGYYVGVARTRVFYSEGLWNTVFIDVLVANKLTYKNPVLTGFSEHKYGGRIGIEGTRSHIGGRLEGGARPGIDRLYLLAQMTFGLMI